jgi:hypothetical protein
MRQTLAFRFAQRELAARRVRPQLAFLCSRQPSAQVWLMVIMEMVK